jgi:MGT family glycosyltransferase
MSIVTEMSVAGLRRAANQIRMRFGLPPLAVPIHQYLSDVPLYLVPSIPELDFDRSDAPDSVHYIGPLIWNDTRSIQAPAWLAQLPHTRPWVHVTEGTMHVYKPFLLQAAAVGLANLPMEVIMTAGGDRNLAAPGLRALAPNVRLEPWIPHTELFHNTDAVVTTGGAGTILTGLAAGIPLVIVPTEWDKADNAQRIVEAGAAIRISPSRCTPSRLRAAVERILFDRNYREMAEKIAGILAKRDGPVTAAALIERTFGRSAVTESVTE